MRTIFEDLTREADGIANATQRRDGTCSQRGAVHDDGVAFGVTVEGEMRAEAGVEDRVVFENDDSSFDGVEC